MASCYFPFFTNGFHDDCARFNYLLCLCATECSSIDLPVNVRKFGLRSMMIITRLQKISGMLKEFCCCWSKCFVFPCVSSSSETICSGHGKCGVNGVCTCYTGWDFAADCSQSMVFVPISQSYIANNLKDVVLHACHESLFGMSDHYCTGKCPSGTAWFDKATAANAAHAKTECSNAVWFAFNLWHISKSCR